MRFRLRSLLLLVTALAIALGIWTNCAFHQRQTTQKIRKLGGDVEYELSHLPLMEKWFGRDFVTTVIAVRMYRLDQDDDFHYVVSEYEFIDCVRQLPSVKRVEGLESNHHDWADRMRRSMPQVEVRLYYGGVI